MKRTFASVLLLTKQFRAVRWLLAVAVLTGWLGSGLEIGQAYVISRVVSDAFLGPRPFLGERSWLGLLLFLFTFYALLQGVGKALAGQLAAAAKRDLRKRLLHHLVALGPHGLQSERRGEMVNTVFAGVDQVEACFSRFIPQIALAALSPLTILFCVLIWDPLTALVLLVTGPLLLFFLMLIGRFSQEASARQWHKLSLLAARLGDMVEGFMTLKVFGRSKDGLAVLKKECEAYRVATMRALRFAFLISLTLEFFSTMSTALVAVFFGLRLVNGGIPFSTAFFLLLLTPAFFQPLRSLGSEFHTGQHGMTALSRIFAILEADPPGLLAEKTVSPALSAAQNIRPLLCGEPCRVEWEGVTFSYETGGPTVLRNICLTVEPGETVVLVGPSGAGKSTLLSLLLGFIRPTSGVIRVQGSPLDEIPLAEWRKKITYLSQHPHVFTGTILSYLRGARPHASMEEIRQACKLARAEEWIAALPQGYQTPLQQGGYGMSGGQWQRLAVARALLKDTPLVLLDEPTAHLDPQTEEAVQQGLRQLLAGKTALVVAHRLSTVQLADRIVVLENGEIVEQGSPRELKELRGRYARLLAAAGGGGMG